MASPALSQDLLYSYIKSQVEESYVLQYDLRASKLQVPQLALATCPLLGTLPPPPPAVRRCLA